METTTGTAGTAGTAKSGGETPKTFTQEEVNALMGGVRAEERTKAAEKFSDYTYLKERAAVADKQDLAKLTNEERLTKDAEAWKVKATQAEQRAVETAIGADIRLKAQEKGIDPDVALALVNRVGVKFAESGVMGVAEALDALLTAKPHLKLATALRAPNLNANGGEKPAATPQLTPQARDVAHKLYPGLAHADAEVKYAKGMTPR